MSSYDYSTLYVLIVDDFHNFRRVLAKNIYDLGFRYIDSVATGEEAIKLCRNKQYDLILSDYNLGDGKNGQQLLEELRTYDYLRADDIFVLISADTSRDVVMCAYDCEPDAFVTKPITGKVLEQRIQRLILKRVELKDIYQSIQLENYPRAIYLLGAKIQEQSRYSVECQKLLGELYLKQKKYDQAEHLYKKVLEVRELDWALVGLANVHIERGEMQQAVESLEYIMDSNPSYLKAYDSLSKVFDIQEDSVQLQKVLERAAEASPMSTARQKKLAETAMTNGEPEIAMKAYKKTMKHGENSHYDTPENHLNFARSVRRTFDDDSDKAKEFCREAELLLANLDTKYKVNEEQSLQAKLINSQIYALEGNSQKSMTLFKEAQAIISSSEDKTIDVDIEMVNALTDNGQKVESEAMLKELIIHYADDQSALEKLDPLLDEPASEKGKVAIAQVNKKGVASYHNKDYEASILFFSQIQKKFPRYIGIKLNLAQAMIATMKESEGNDEYLEECNVLFKVIDQHITPISPHFIRYKQLQAMMRQL